MTLVTLLAMTAVAILLGLAAGGRWRIYSLLGVSAIAVYALQPALPLRGLDFWLPTATLALAVFGWLLTVPEEGRSLRANWPAAVLLGCIVFILGLTRSLGFNTPFTASRPPQLILVLVALAGIALIVFLLWRFSKPGRILLLAGCVAILGLFVLLKVPAFVQWSSIGLRHLSQQSIQLATPLDIRWLGFSYVAFRLIHTFRDRRSGRLPAVSLAEYLVYIIFFPSISAGPIDRIERFVSDLRLPLTHAAGDWIEASKRFVLGLFKKFVLADTLALIALNGVNALQVRAAGWMWILLYAYAFQIYFDFSGYTDLAIGMGRFLGIRLPENFAAPYLKPNLTQFWNNWHITLTQWFRAYFFNPVTRALRSSRKLLPIPLIIFLTQVATMMLIGLWHGVTWNFLLWGVWHGLGLFIHNRWSELARPRFSLLKSRWQTILNLGGTFLTFQYVTLGWAFFALPSLSLSLHVFRVLLGLR